MEILDFCKMLSVGNFISSDEATVFAKDAIEKQESPISIISRAKNIPQSDLAFYISKKFGLSFLDISVLDLDKIPQDFENSFYEKYRAIPIKKHGNTLYVALADPTKLKYFPELKLKYKLDVIKTVVVEDNKINAAIAQILQSKVSSFADSMAEDGNDMIDMAGDEELPTNTGADAAEVDDAPVVKFISKIILEAIKLKVSDIHMEPYEKFYRVRYRLDGVLYETARIPTGLKDKISSRIKVVSKMDISEKRVPQDGRLKFPITKERNIDLRVSTLPTLYGEKIVMRILDNSAGSLNIDALGYADLEKKRLLDAVARPYGMVLVTGPTGSGKTVSLYSCINILNKDSVNISTAEDPAEIILPGINQVNVNDKAGLTFEAALKSFLRQDPDIIMVGEIRDLGTADIAIKAAQTGHLVLSTLHTNDGPTTLTRLMNMGVAPFNIASSVILITAQRLARKLCPKCKEEEKIPEETLLQEGFLPKDLVGYDSTWKSYKPVGCAECGDKGYKGRIGLYQVMPISEKIQELILTGGTAMDIAQQAKADGVLTLREAGLAKVKDGLTSLEEVCNVTNI